MLTSKSATLHTHTDIKSTKHTNEHFEVKVLLSSVTTHHTRNLDILYFLSVSLHQESRLFVSFSPRLAIWLIFCESPPVKKTSCRSTSVDFCATILSRKFQSLRGTGPSSRAKSDKDTILRRVRKRNVVMWSIVSTLCPCTHVTQ